MLQLQTASGTIVHYASWQTPQTQAVVLLVYGLGAHIGRWEATAKFLVQKNFSVYAVELIGFGESPEPRGHVDSFKLYYQHISALAEEIRKKHPGKKIFLLAESMGGLLAHITAARRPELWDGLILISPAYGNGLRFSLWDYLVVFTNIFFRPQKTISLPFTAAMCTRDADYQKVMEADPRELRKASAGLLIHILLAQLAASRHLGRLQMPVLFLLAGQDLLVSPKASEAVFKRLRMQDKTLIHYPAMRHALSIELGKETVFADIHRWLQARI